ncbi:mitochondrial import receptor subunit TOM40 [Pancytospora philotis]|nr:mitochondrial import receptor subunit TOM40 [Pancytospora philotis]
MLGCRAHMAWSLKNLFSADSKPLATSYDSYNREAAALTNHSRSTGIKYEISKMVLPYLQLSAIKTGHSPTVQYFTTLSFPRSVFQMCFDTDRSYQLRSSVACGPITARIHSIVSSKREVYAQLESLYSGRFYNMGLKLISPAIQASNLIYVFNCWRAFGRVFVGMEAVGMDGELGIALSSRYEKNDSVYCLSLQRFNLVVASFYRRVFGNVEVGAELQRSQSYFSTAAGLRLRTFRTELKCSVDQSLNFGCEWNEKLTEGLTVSFNGTCDEAGFNYGVGLFFEG